MSQAGRLPAVVRKPRAPAEMPAVTLPANGSGDGLVHLPALLSDAFGVSRSEARRSLEQGGVKLDGEPLASTPLDRPLDELDGRVLQLGKRRFARLVRPS